jgi:hypothetical protein
MRSPLGFLEIIEEQGFVSLVVFLVACVLSLGLLLLLVLQM